MLVFLGVRRNLVITGVYIESKEKTHVFCHLGWWFEMLTSV